MPRFQHRCLLVTAHAGAQLGLAFTLPDDLAAIYAGFGITLPEFNGDESWQLPVPARVVVGADGVIRHVDADPDYTRRPEPEATLAVLDELVGG